MGFDVGDFLTGGASGALGAGMGLLLQGHNNDVQAKQQQRLTDIQTNAQKDMTNYNYQKQLDMWNATSYGPQMQNMKAAGLNPGLMYGLGGGGGQSNNVATGSVSGGNAGQNTGEVAQGMGLSMQAAQLALMNAQKQNIEADTANKQAGAGKTTAETENVPKQGANIEANTANTQQNTQTQKSQQQGQEIQNSQNAQAMKDRLTEISANAAKSVQELQQAVNNTNVSDNTIPAKIKQIRADAINAVLDSALIKAKTANTQAGTANTEQATLTDQTRRRQIAAQIEQGWQGLGIQEQKNEIQKMLGNRGLDLNEQNQVLNAIESIMFAGSKGTNTIHNY